MKGFTLTLLALIGILSISSGCGTTMKPVLLPDGRSITHPYKGSRPLPATNALFIVEVAGYRIHPTDEDARAHLTWTFCITELGPEIQDVMVFELSDLSREIPLEKEWRNATNRYWAGISEPTLIDNQSFPWLYQPGDTKKFFEFAVTTTNGTLSQLVQPVMFSQDTKKNHAYHIWKINHLNAIRTADPDAKVLIVE